MTRYRQGGAPRWEHIVAADELDEAMILDGPKCDHERGVLFRKAKGIDAMPEEPLVASVGAHEPELESFQPDAEWDFLAGGADTEDEGETVGQADGELQALEEAPAAHQVAVVVESGCSLH